MRLLAIALLSLASCRSEQYRARLATGDEVRFVRAIKGNDVVVDKGGELARVRLVGVYAFDPTAIEKSDISSWAKKAVGLMGERAGAGTMRVVLEREELDPRGRHLGFLESGGTDLGRVLIEEGHGAVYTEYPFSREADYLGLEATVRQGERGLWGKGGAGKRVRALRETWSSVRERERGQAPADPLLGKP